MSLPGIQDWRNAVNDGGTRQALDAFTAQLQGFLGVEHNADGTHPFGTWTNEAYSAQKFTANGTMTWTVPGTSDAIKNFSWTKLGKMLTVSWYFRATTVVIPVNTTLYLAIPNGYMPARRAANPFMYLDNGVAGMGAAVVFPNDTRINLAKDFSFGVNWTASAANTFLAGQITFEVL